ncbi:Macrolide export ATP-binding/permease protein MacB [Planctomycetes bacterium Poly30]|uniref:Macrolide export ATP-binding/permease protein MacB n=1 Tax=Saltatorellus ferox TaxID=2528018 RepID=A0A518EKP0_9BACT|nr:Macrolide export ATP-binding/permease protein MacB [Planctomycetes bacterium Poly30]
MSDPVIQMSGIGRDYAGAESNASGVETTVRALRDIDLEVLRGEALAVLGPSGSGKSTLLNLLGLLDTPTRGSYRLDGREVSTLDLKELARARNQKIGFVFQRFHLVPRLDAIENVALPLRFAGIRRRERRRRAAELLEKLGLSDRATHRPAELSGGQQQRVAIARAMVCQPSLLLADEPTGALDQSTGSAILDLLTELHAEGMTLIVVTHDEALGARLPRRIRMLDGAVLTDEIVGS